MYQAIVESQGDLPPERDRLVTRLLTATVGRRSTGWAAGCLYAAAHGLYMAVVLAVLAVHEHMSPARALQRWDGLIYQRIAAHGYQSHFTYFPNGKPTRMDIAFFPLYPFAMRAVSTVTRLPLEASGVLISVLAGIAAAVGIALLVEPRFGRPTALLSVVLWAVGVDAMIQSMVYVQSLIAAFAVWTVIALVRRRWILATVLVVLAGLCHSTAVALVATVEVVAVLQLVRIVRGSRGSADVTVVRDRRTAAGLVAMAAVAPLGIVAYWTFLALRFHRWDAWFYAESAPGWNSKFDLGQYSVKTLLSQLDGSDLGHGTVTEAHLIATLWIVPAAVICLLLARDLLRGRRVPWQLSVLTIVTVALALSDSGPWASKPRFFIPAVGLAVLPADWLARRSAVTRGLVVTVVGAISVLCCAFMIGVSPVAP
jgi:hypothetical protein